MQISNKTVLVAPLNWGLGHATRCIIIIQKLLDLNCKVIIASDGEALGFLRAEFPNLVFLELPSYKITYSKRALFFKIKLASQFFAIYKAYQSENCCVAQWVDQYGIDVIISDNRFGVYSAKIPSIYITHQLCVLSGSSTWLTTKIHQQLIKKFSMCWVPDFNDATLSLSGKLSISNLARVTKIGILSRLKKEPCVPTIDILFLVSGPEPQRKQLTEIFRKEMRNTSDLRIVLVCGLVEKTQKITQRGLLTEYNYATSEQMNNLLNSSKLVVCRSGYSTIMDLSQLGKKALLIPTPGQDEQEYLAQYLYAQNFLPYVDQNKFSIHDLDLIKSVRGLPHSNALSTELFNKLFANL